MWLGKRSNNLEYRNWTIFPECTIDRVCWKAVKNGKVLSGKRDIASTKEEIDEIESRPKNNLYN